MNSNPLRARPTGLILAGGESRRFFGEEKGLVEFHGQPMVAHVARVFDGQVERLLISANRCQHQYQRYADEVIDDQIGESWGPLAGIYTGLCMASTDWLLVATCDQPLLPLDYAARMIDKFDGKAVLMATDLKRDHFLNLLLPTSAVTFLRDYLLNGGRRVQSWLKQVGYKKMEFPPDCLNSINSPAALLRTESERKSAS